MIQMKYYLPKITFLCVCFAVLIAASAVKAQAIYPAEESETITATSPNGNQTVTVILPRRAIQPAEVAIIVNRQDPQSVDVAAYYQLVRNIPAANVIEVSFPAALTSITQKDFEIIKAQVDAAVSALPDIQALVITWTEPWKVKENDSGKGMSITSAFALGFDVDYYNDTSLVCQATRETPYYNTNSVRPYSDFGLRPAMMLAGVNKQNVIDLIDKAVSADQTFPGGDGYLIRTTDNRRSDPRYKTFINTVDSFNRTDALVMNYIDNSAGVRSDNYISNTPDVLFYFTGLVTVPEIATNSYVAGAVADHLTSAGGRLTGPNPQMSVLSWLEAGAIASYGTVIEPCNFAAKFTHTTNFVTPYFSGSTVLEAYWKSVRTPGEGIFVGDPLTRPYGTRVTLGDDGIMDILTTILLPEKTYTLLEAGSVDGPFTIVQLNIEVTQLSFSSITQRVGNSVYVLAENLTPDIQPNTPLLFLPEDDKTDVLLSPELQAYGLAGTAGDIHSKSRWQVSSLAGDFSTGALVLDLTSESQLTTFIVPDLMLDINSTYHWRVKFQYESGAQSEWSNPFSFTTIISDERDQNNDGIPDGQELDDPDLDLDANGEPDITQGDMKGVKSGFDNAPLVVQAAANVTSIDSLCWIDPDTITEMQNRPDDTPVGLINFKMSVNTPGAVAEVVVYFSQAASDGAEWYQYSPQNGWQDYSAHAVFSADRKSVTLAFTDGGFGDTDGAANGVIVDPSGIGANEATPVDGDPPVSAESSSGGGGGGGGGGCLISSTAVSEFPSPNQILGVVVFLASLLIGYKIVVATKAQRHKQ